MTPDQEAKIMQGADENVRLALVVAGHYLKYTEDEMAVDIAVIATGSGKHAAVGVGRWRLRAS